MTLNTYVYTSVRRTRSWGPRLRGPYPLTLRASNSGSPSIFRQTGRMASTAAGGDAQIQQILPSCPGYPTCHVRYQSAARILGSRKPVSDGLRPPPGTISKPAYGVQVSLSQANVGNANPGQPGCWHKPSNSGHKRRSSMHADEAWCGCIRLNIWHAKPADS
jgi:hypothetical protein